MESLLLPLRVLALLAVAAATHLLVVLIRRTAARFARRPHREHRKLRSIVTVLTSAIVFMLYFFVFGLILREFGVSLTAYLASASVLGLAIGFGSQGIVQDVVTGLTLIFSDLIDVGDLVEISGQAGVVRSISMRFVELENALGATVFIPNRTIYNVVNYPSGYVRCLVDVTLLGDAAAKDAMQETTARLMTGFHEQFPGILITPPSIEGRHRVASGKEFLRLKFRIWPNRGGPIESAFVQELVATLKRAHEDYQPWMVAVTYEIEARTTRPQNSLLWPLKARRARAAPERTPRPASSAAKATEKR
ncbi:MAG: mechanosensitive ion channel [Gammaproteobacteria bacterium]|nr:mechanosensitive ion channel [Gammaproteobacteria bacterium]